MSTKGIRWSGALIGLGLSVSLMVPSATAVRADMAGQVSAAAARHSVEATPTQIANVAPKRLVGQPQMFDFGQYPDIAPLQGAQGCDPTGPSSLTPTAGRIWTYYNPENDMSGFSADVAVTGWADSAQAFHEMVTNTGKCLLFDELTIAPWPGQDPSTHAIVTGTPGPHSLAVAVIRTGPYVVAVTVADWTNAGDELAAAQAAAERVARRL